MFFSSPEPKAPGELLGWEGSVVRPSSVRPQFQTTSPLKLLGQLQLNFISGLSPPSLGMGPGPLELGKNVVLTKIGKIYKVLCIEEFIVRLI